MSDSEENVVVAVRVRPFNDREIERNAKLIIDMPDGKSTSIRWFRKHQLLKGIQFLETLTLITKNQSGSLLITVIGPMMGLKQRRMDIQRPQTRIMPIRWDFVLSFTTILYRVKIINSYF